MNFAMATNYRVKMGKIGQLTFIRRIGIHKQSRISQFRFKIFICDDLSTLCRNLVNFSLVTPEFKKGKKCTPLGDQQFGYATPLLDFAGISTEFSKAIATQLFLANVNVLRYVCYMLSAVRLSSVCLSVVCLSSVTLVHPTQAVELFGIFFTIR